MPAASLQLNTFVPAPAGQSRDKAPGFLARMLVSMQDAQMRRAEREIARFIETRGGRLTDTLERQIEKHFV